MADWLIGVKEDFFVIGFKDSRHDEFVVDETARDPFLPQTISTSQKDKKGKQSSRGWRAGKQAIRSAMFSKSLHQILCAQKDHKNQKSCVDSMWLYSHTRTMCQRISTLHCACMRWKKSVNYEITGDQAERVCLIENLCSTTISNFGATCGRLLGECVWSLL